MVSSGYGFHLAGEICRMLNAERDYSLLGQRNFIHARLNPNPIANHKPYPNPKITQRARLKSFMAAITKRLAIW